MDILNFELPEFAFFQARGFENRLILMHVKTRVPVEILKKEKYLLVDLGETPRIEFTTVDHNGVHEYIMAAYINEGLPWSRDEYFDILEACKEYYIRHLNMKPSRYFLEDAFEIAINERGVYKKLDTYKGNVLNIRARYRSGKLSIGAIQELLTKLGWKRVIKEIWEEPRKE